jgi:hypothetical protein
MMSELSKLSKMRNWSKYRLMGVNFPREGLTLQEQSEICEIQSKILNILKKWDERSLELNIVPRKKATI